MSERGTRFQRSVLTFGPAGRVVATVLVLMPLAWFALYAGIFGLIGFPMWLLFVVPTALRDVWRPAALPATDLTRLRDAARLEADVRARFEAREQVDSITDNPGRRRW